MRWRAKIIKLLGGYTEDEVLTEVVKELYNTIDSNDILKEENGYWTISGKKIDEGVKQLIISEAKVFLGTKLWKILQADVKYRANKAMFERSKTAEDLVAGKLWLFTLDSINTRLESLAKESGRFNSDAR